jgi:hypothetical protein
VDGDSWLVDPDSENGRDGRKRVGQGVHVLGLLTFFTMFFGMPNLFAVSARELLFVLTPALQLIGSAAHVRLFSPRAIYVCE